MCESKNLDHAQYWFAVRFMTERLDETADVENYSAIMDDSYDRAAELWLKFVEAYEDNHAPALEQIDQFFSDIPNQRVCPNCQNKFTMDYKNPEHQVNYIFEKTFCCVDCSEKYMFFSSEGFTEWVEKLREILGVGVKPNLEQIIEHIKTECLSEHITPADIDQLAVQVYLKV